MNFKIFISYSTKDSLKINQIFELLKTIQNTEIFFSERTIPPGVPISQNIIHSIRNCDVFLVFFSKFAKESNYVQQEIGAAKGNNKIIIPILLDDTKPTGVLEGINYLNLSNPSKHDEEMRRLYSFLIRQVQNKKRNQALGLLTLLGLGYFMSREEENS